MPAAISVVTLLTDFGDRDYFVASMKGVILNINPHVRLVDLSHRVTPQDVEAAAFLLKSSYHYFPDGTVHVVVVDPGVGTKRRALLVTSPRYFFLGPDNGVLTHIFRDEVGVEVRAIENRQYRLDAEGATFDGRDLFAPSAAWLTRGQAPGTYGPLVRDYVTLSIPAPSFSGDVLTGRVAHVDHFGNLITDVTTLLVKELQGKTRRQTVRVRIAGLSINDLAPSYAEGEANRCSALINSNGQVEIFLKNGSAAEFLKVGRGERVEVF
jgi:hypothetical protein